MAFLESKTPDRKPRILIAEDDEDDFFFFHRALKKCPGEIEIVRAKDGAEAIDYLQAHGSALPNLIITDIKMPRADGFEVLKWLKANPKTAQIPAVVLSSSDEPQDRERGEALGAEAYHVKTGNMRSVNSLANQICRKFFPAIA